MKFWEVMHKNQDGKKKSISTQPEGITPHTAQESRLNCDNLKNIKEGCFLPWYVAACIA